MCMGLCTTCNFQLDCAYFIVIIASEFASLHPYCLRPSASTTPPHTHGQSVHIHPSAVAQLSQFICPNSSISIYSCSFHSHQLSVDVHVWHLLLSSIHHPPLSPPPAPFSTLLDRHSLHLTLFFTTLVVHPLPHIPFHPYGGGSSSSRRAATGISYEQRRRRVAAHASSECRRRRCTAGD